MLGRGAVGVVLQPVVDAVDGQPLRCPLAHLMTRRYVEPDHQLGELPVHPVGLEAVNQDGAIGPRKGP